MLYQTREGEFRSTLLPGRTWSFDRTRESRRSAEAAVVAAEAPVLSARRERFLREFGREPKSSELHARTPLVPENRTLGEQVRQDAVVYSSPREPDVEASYQRRIAEVEADRSLTPSQKARRLEQYRGSLDQLREQKVAEREAAAVRQSSGLDTARVLGDSLIVALEIMPDAPSEWIAEARRQRALLDNPTDPHAVVTAFMEWERDIEAQRQQRKRERIADLNRQLAELGEARDAVRNDQPDPAARMAAAAMEKARADRIGFDPPPAPPAPPADADE